MSVTMNAVIKFSLEVRTAVDSAFDLTALTTTSGISREAREKHLLNQKDRDM